MALARAKVNHVTCGKDTDLVGILSPILHKATVDVFNMVTVSTHCSLVPRPFPVEKKQPGNHCRRMRTEFRKISGKLFEARCE